MPKIEEDLQTWSSRFESLGVSKQLLTEALSIKPENAKLDALFTICEKIRTLFREYEFQTS